MEFGRGQKLFTGFAHDNGDNTLGLLRAVTTVMQQRAQRLRGQTRLHTPTTAEPLIVLIVDEIASLTAYIGDRKIRAEVEQLLGLLLSQGRAVGVSVIAAVQDPSKDVLPIRQLFSIRVGLRMTESTQTTMVLGAAAREAGAVCDQIPTSTPGVGYVCEDGDAEPVRVRAFHVTDPDIDYLTTHFAPHQPSAGTSGTGNAHAMTLTPSHTPAAAAAAAATIPVLPGLPAGIDSTDVVVQMVRRAASPGFESWWRKAENVGFCANPIHLHRHRHVRPAASGSGPAATTAARSRARRARICMPATPGSSCTPACTADTTTCPPPSPSTRRCSSP